MWHHQTKISISTPSPSPSSSSTERHYIKRRYSTRALCLVCGMHRVLDQADKILGLRTGTRVWCVPGGIHQRTCCLRQLKNRRERGRGREKETGCAHVKLASSDCRGGGVTIFALYRCITPKRGNENGNPAPSAVRSCHIQHVRTLLYLVPNKLYRTRIT